MLNIDSCHVAPITHHVGTGTEVVRDF